MHAQFRVGSQSWKNVGPIKGRLPLTISAADAVTKLLSIGVAAIAVFPPCRGCLLA